MREEFYDSRLSVWVVELKMYLVGKVLVAAVVVVKLG